MRYSRPVRIILGLLCFAVIFWYESRWYNNSVMGSDAEKALESSTPALSEEYEAFAAYLQQLVDSGEAEAGANDPEAIAAYYTQFLQRQQQTGAAAAAPEMSTTPAPERPEVKKAAELGLPEPPEIDISEWQYVLVNGDHPLDPIDYEPSELAYLNMTGDDTEILTGYDPNRQMVDILIAQPLVDMVQGCKAAGLPVFLSSGYRSYATQQANFERVCYNNGITDGKNAEGNYITMPAGCSEHQTGLCIDITDYYHEIKNDELAQLPTVQWLAEHCADYGFVLRFPQDKRDVTHVMGESWHFRYVGEEAAKYMTENNLVLEEFVALYGVE